MAGVLEVSIKVFNNIDKIIADEQKAADRAFRRAGSLVRKIARSSVRRTNKNSPPGRPPRTHVRGAIGAKNVLYDYNRRRRSLVVGPGRKPGRDNSVPDALEFGGTTFIRLPPSLRRALGRLRLRARIRPRPYIGPAGRKFEKQYPDAYANAWKGVGR